MTTTDHWTIRRGTQEYRKVTVTADVTLDTQPVAFSLDGGTTWLDAEWTGSTGMTRTARILLGPDNTPDRRSGAVEVRVTDDPEIPWIKAGTYTIV